MEKLPIDGETVHKSIHEAIDKEEITLSKLENEIVDEIVQSFPDTPTGLSFARWCKYTVNDLINKIPADRLEDAQRIKITIGKEIRYILEKDAFNAVAALIEEKNPRWITPNWFLTNAKSFCQQVIYAGFRTEDGEVDWRLVVDKLGIADKFKFSEDNDFAEKSEEYAMKLLSLLEEHKPEKFNPAWIKKQDINLTARMLNQPFRDEEGNVDWLPIISLLPEEWRDRWESRRNMSVERVAYDIKKLDEKFNPEKISPYWLTSKDASLVQYVTENVRDTEADAVDWDRVLSLLPQSIRDKWALRRAEWTTQDAITDLRTLLDKENPTTLNPTWIAKQNDGAYRTIVKAIDTGEYDSWKDFITKEFPEWAEKYELKHREVAGNWHTLLEAILERNNPKKFSPSWIESQDASLCSAIRAEFKDEKGEVNWMKFIEGLSPQWQERFEVLRKVWTTEEMHQELLALLEKENPEYFYPSWISRNNMALATYIIKNFRDEKGVDWQKALEKLPDHWQERWRIFPNISTPKEVTDNLTDLVQQKDPKQFNPSWISKEDLTLYRKIQRMFRTETNFVDWNTVIDSLPQELQSRWVRRRVYEECIPDTTFEDDKQVTDALGEYADKLYTFYGIVEPNDTEARDIICNILINLSQKGNISAEKLLADNVVHLAFSWIEEREAFKTLRNHMADIPEIIRRAIYIFSHEGSQRKTNFLGYLFSALRLAAQHKYQGSVSLHGSWGGDGITLEERLGRYDDDEDIYLSGEQQN